MATNLISLLQSELTDDVVGKLATSLGEPVAKTQSALGYAVPGVLAGMVQKAQTKQGATELLDVFQRSGVDGSSSTSLANTLRSSTGASDLLQVAGPLLSSLFGTRQNSVTDAIAGSSGIGKAATGTLLALIGPYIARLVGSEATAAGGFNASSLASLLGGQGQYLASALPAGLAQLLGFSGQVPVSTEETRTHQQVKTAPLAAYENVERQGGGMGWLKWAIPALLLGLFFWGMRGRNAEPIGVPEAPSAAVVGTTGTLPAAPALVTQRLSCGQEIEAAPNGVEAKLVVLIDDRSRPVSDSAWVSFDRLEFDSASATLNPRSESQIRNIAAIMACYPNVHLKVGGYTDNVGDASANLSLSQARAQNTVAAIVAQGVPASRLEAEGFGDQHPIASNQTAEGRQRNRRIDVRVTAR